MNDNSNIIAHIKDTWKGKLFCCPFNTCGSGLSNNGTIVCIRPSDESLVQCKCPKCNKEWFLCIMCNNLGKTIHPLLSSEAVHNHNYRLGHNRFKNIRKRRKKGVVSDEQRRYNVNEINNVVSVASMSNINSTLVTQQSLDVDNYRSNDYNSDVEEWNFCGSGDDDDDLTAVEPEYDSTLQTNDSLSSTNDNPFGFLKYKESIADNTPLTVKNMFYHFSKNMSLFYANHCKDNSGLKYLVSKSFTSSPDTISNLSTEEVRFQLMMTQFVRNLTRPQQRDFADVLSEMNNLYINPPTPSDQLLLCQFPTTYNDLCRHYTTGVHSMSMNMPRPESTMLLNHSYLHIHECIADLLLQGKVTLTTTHNLSTHQQKSNSIFGTKIANMIVNEAIVRYREQALLVSLPLITVFVMLWSDDFEPNKSQKADRHGVWALTATFFVMNHEGFPEFITYPISFGSKGIDHEEVHKQILKDILSLRSGTYTIMYSTYLKTPICVHADIFAVLCDHPERRSTLKLAAGNSYYHTQFGKSCPFKTLQHVILPCLTCKNQELNGNINCERCSNWLLFENSPLLRFSASKDFPSEKLDDDNKLSAHTLSFTDLIASVTYVHEEVVKNNMTKDSVIAFLKYKCINSQSIEQIYECAYNCRLLEVAERNKDSNEYIFNDLMEDKVDHPEKYRMWSIPSNWKYFASFERFVEVPMHLFFLNCKKTIVKDIHTWLKCQRKFTYFQTKTKGLLETIQKLQLVWLKLQPYPEGNGAGWVSENWMGLCRISMWLYQILEILPDPPAYSDPITHPSTWTKKESMAWLSARGLPSGKLKAQELKDIVLSYYNSGQLPEILPVKGCPVATVLQMIREYYHIVSIGMSLQSEDIGIKMQKAVRVFLTTYSEFSDSISDNLKEPSYFSKYSFMSLLNLPNQLKNYGSMRYIWEGGINGEGFLRLAKPQIKHGLNRNWPKWLIDHLLLDKTCQDLCQLISPKQNLPNNDRFKEIKIYSNKGEAMNSMHSGLPFAGMAIKNGETWHHYLVFHDGRQNIKKIEIKLLETESVINKLSYFIIQLAMNNDGNYMESDILVADIEVSIIGVLFLPQLHDGHYVRKINEEDVIEYTAIYSNWSVIDESVVLS
jgi:hypothetical protein